MIYILKHWWSDDPKAPPLEVIPYGCWAEFDAKKDTFWRIMATSQRKTMPLVASTK
jgi:hypothetical protein